METRTSGEAMLDIWSGREGSENLRLGPTGLRASAFVEGGEGDGELPLPLAGEGPG